MNPKPFHGSFRPKAQHDLKDYSPLSVMLQIYARQEHRHSHCNLELPVVCIDPYFLTPKTLNLKVKPETRNLKPWGGAGFFVEGLGFRTDA